MYIDRQAVESKGAVCTGVLTPQPPEGGAFEEHGGG